MNGNTAVLVNALKKGAEEKQHEVYEICVATLAFEYSTVDVEVQGRVESILNPTSGIIRADSIGELIMEKDRIDTGKTQIVCPNIEKRLEHFSA